MHAGSRASAAATGRRAHVGAASSGPGAHALPSEEEGSREKVAGKKRGRGTAQRGGWEEGGGGGGQREREGVGGSVGDEYTQRPRTGGRGAAGPARRCVRRASSSSSSGGSEEEEKDEDDELAITVAAGMCVCVCIIYYVCMYVYICVCIYMVYL